ncbi:MAG: Gfo/Idh/MocA family oxidoreductase [Phycisphaeraceae bacterium]|nr:Gfo/Idh/MocA family oxidoreductase [Phycisphaeraceae bacterium]
MSEHRTIGVGVVGMGFMGWRHVEAYDAAARHGFACAVVAVCDPSEEKRRAPSTGGNISSTIAAAPPTRDFAGHACLDDMLADERVDLVSVCTHTESHVDIALQALRAGKHVLVEKPVALRAEAVRPLADAARGAKTLCMPAHCMRFWPGWDWLRDAIASGEHGRVLSATFLREGAAPGWASHFYSDTTRSGGALGDFHIHDADFIRWALGKPDEVCCAGDDRHVTTLYRFGSGGPAHVSAEAGWTRAHGAGFRMRYTVDFERATAEFEMGREPVLTLSDEHGAREIEIPDGTGYDHEIRHIVGAIAQGRRDLRVTMDDALATAELLDAERESRDSGRWVSL